ncbi:AP2 domain-containing protein [Rhodococcus erythropolis]
MIIERMHPSISRPKMIDHRNGRPLDNRRSNLRPATATTNSRNMKMKSTSKQPYKGTERRRSGRYSARIRVGNCRINLGTYKTGEEAAYMYDQFAIELFGEFAKTNLIGES